jgi:alpha-beta hydrolase superfamily lysophospholipase
VRRALVRILKVGSLLVAGTLLGFLAAILGFATRGTQPQAWHQLRPASEFTAVRAAEVRDLEGYLRLEAKLFEETAAALARRVERFPALSRFDPASPTSPARFDRDWNRTFELAPAGEPSGEALLLHGLSDSPYSLRAVGRLLAAHGFHVVGLRLPGHGAVPGGLAAATRADWRAAVRLGVAATGGRERAPGLPFVIVGYSNGAALALDYTLTALEESRGVVPDRLVFLSPAIAVSPAAAFARLQQWAARIPGLGKLAWIPIEAEFDPFKFNSFPISAAAEIHGLTSEIEAKLAWLERDPDRTLPPLLTLQSVVDATVPPVASLTRLYSRVRRSERESELVLFDANRRAGMAELLDPQVDDLRALAQPGRPFDFRLTLVTNGTTGTAQVAEETRAPGSLERVTTPLDLEWPRGLYSLTHVAIPFPPDDPAYGGGSSPAGPPFPFGALDLKGERGVFRIPDSLLTRLRYNPFFAVVERKIVAFLGAAPAGSPDA